MEVDSDEEEEEEESEDDVKGKGKGKAVAGTQSGKKSVKYTPLELQVIELKKANPGVLLMIEVRIFDPCFSGPFVGLRADHRIHLITEWVQVRFL